MSHECEICGMWCDCDGEDMPNPQPNDCDHLTGGGCDADDLVDEEESEAK